MAIISVVIPVYNGEKTITATIRSVLEQTFIDLEIIVINDGSTDTTVEVVEKIEDQRVRLYSYENGGLATSRNRGIDRSQGDYISFIDADDLWTLDKLASQYQALQEYPQAAVAYSGTDWIDEQGNFLRHASAPGPSGNVYAYALLYNFFGSGSNFLVRREAILTIGGFDQETRPCEDWDMCVRLAMKYEFICLPVVHILYRQLPNSMSSNLIKLERGITKTVRKSFSQAPTNLQYLQKISFANVYRYLTAKSAEGIPTHLGGWQGLKMFIKFLAYDITPLKQKVTWKVLARILIMLFLPPKWGLILLNKFPQLLRIGHFISYTRTHL